MLFIHSLPLSSILLLPFFSSFFFHLVSHLALNPHPKNSINFFVVSLELPLSLSLSRPFPDNAISDERNPQLTSIYLESISAVYSRKNKVPEKKKTQRKTND